MLGNPNVNVLNTCKNCPYTTTMDKTPDGYIIQNNSGLLTYVKMTDPSKKEIVAVIRGHIDILSIPSKPGIWQENKFVGILGTHVNTSYDPTTNLLAIKMTDSAGNTISTTITKDFSKQIKEHGGKEQGGFHMGGKELGGKEHFSVMGRNITNVDFVILVILALLLVYIIYKKKGM